MYKINYDVMKPKGGNNYSLLYSNTDSYFKEIKTEDFTLICLVMN